MRISDWSSDVCSSDLGVRIPFGERPRRAGPATVGALRPAGDALLLLPVDQPVQGPTVAVETERTAVEYQLGLPADADKRDARQPRLGDPVRDPQANTQAVIFDLIGQALAQSGEGPGREKGGRCEK